MIFHEPIAAHLTPRSAERFGKAVTELQRAVAAGRVPNALFVSAKETINRVIEESANAFLDSGPHVKGRDGQPHHQSDWWLDAYDADAFLSGAHGVPTALKRATKAGMVEYVGFIAYLVPLHALLQDAKSMIVKRGDEPKQMTAKQIADDALRMTCQCCGRRIHANTGRIAHHGYERPDYGYQTASCAGAKELPFEADRTVLGHVISTLQDMKKAMVTTRGQIADETRSILRSWETGSDRRNNRLTHRFEFTRDNYNSTDGFAARRACSLYGDFDELLARELAIHDRRIESIKLDINAQRARHLGWKQTHKWDGSAWVAV
jgi:hypothetical protein